MLGLRGLYRPDDCFEVTHSIVGLGVMIVQLEGGCVSLCQKRVSFESEWIKGETMHRNLANLPQDTAWWPVEYRRRSLGPQG